MPASTDINPELTKYYTQTLPQWRESNPGSTKQTPEEAALYNTLASVKKQNPTWTAADQLIQAKRQNGLPLTPAQLASPFGQNQDIYSGAAQANAGIGASTATTPSFGSVTVGAPSVGYSAAYGGVPQAPNLQQQQQQSITGNTALLPQLQNLATGVNQGQQAALTGQYSSLLPNYSQLFNQAGQNIQSQLSGQVAPDVLANIQRQAAAFGVSSGQPGSQLTNYGALRNYGLTSMDMQQRGQDNLLKTVAGTPVAKPYDVTSAFTTPEQNYDTQLAANLYASAPNPAAAASTAQAANLQGIQAAAQIAQKYSQAATTAVGANPNAGKTQYRTALKTGPDGAVTEWGYIYA